MAGQMKELSDVVACNRAAKLFSQTAALDTLIHEILSADMIPAFNF